MADFHGLPTGSLASPFLHLEYLREGGMRIVRLLRIGDERNLLAETPDFGWETPHGWFAVRGGHRLWHAPQTDRTAMPETQPLQVAQEELSLRLAQPADPWNQLSKSLDILLNADRAALTIVHTIGNEGDGAVELAPWAITQLPPGGQAVLPLPDAAASTAPNRILAFWPYVHLPDPRLEMDSGCLRFSVFPHANEFKLGYFNTLGWVAYEWQGLRLVKYFDPQPGLPHADSGSNVEIYCNNDFFELETLGPLVTLQPGQSD